MAIAINGHRQAAHRSLDEAWQHHAVIAALAWPNHVEKTHEGNRQLMLASVRIGEVFAGELGHGIRPTRPVARFVGKLVGLGLRGVSVEAVHLGGRSHHHARPSSTGCYRSQQPLRPGNVGRQHADRIIEYPPYADNRGKMVDLIGGSSRRPQPIPGNDVRLVEAKRRMIAEGGDVLGATGAEIVDNVHRMSFGQEKLNQMRPDEACSAGDENAHYPGGPRVVFRSGDTGRQGGDRKRLQLGGSVSAHYRRRACHCTRRTRFCR